jgi:hypothetical protein
MKRQELRNPDGLTSGWSSVLGWYAVADPLGDQNIRPEAGYVPLCTLGSRLTATELQLMTMPGTKECLVWINWWSGCYEFVVVPSSVEGLEFLRRYAPIIQASNGDLQNQAQLTETTKPALEALVQKLSEIASVLRPRPRDWLWTLPRPLFRLLHKLGFVAWPEDFAYGTVKTGYRDAVRLKVREPQEYL